MSLSVRICLLALTVVLLFSASEAVLSGQNIPCCTNFSSRKVHIIKACYEQKPRRNCNHAFLVMNKRGTWCIKPDAEWLKQRIETGKLHCPPDLTF